MLFYCFVKFEFYIIMDSPGPGIPTHRVNYLFINIQDVKLIEVLATFHNPACVEIIILCDPNGPQANADPITPNVGDFHLPLVCFLVKQDISVKSPALLMISVNERRKHFFTVDISKSVKYVQV